MDEKCQYYISVEEPECGKQPVVGQVSHIPLRNGSVKKLDKPILLCEMHKAHVDHLFASLRSASKS